MSCCAALRFEESNLSATVKAIDVNHWLALVRVIVGRTLHRGWLRPTHADQPHVKLPGIHDRILRCRTRPTHEPHVILFHGITAQARISVLSNL